MMEISTGLLIGIIVGVVSVIIMLVALIDWLGRPERERGKLEPRSSRRGTRLDGR